MKELRDSKTKTVLIQKASELRKEILLAIKTKVFKIGKENLKYHPLEKVLKLKTMFIGKDVNINFLTMNLMIGETGREFNYEIFSIDELVELESRI